MDKPVLMHADVHKSTEGRHVGNNTFEHHAGHQILDLMHAFLELSGFEFGTRIATGLFQFLENVRYRRYAELLVCVVRSLQA